MPRTTERPVGAWVPRRKRPWEEELGEYYPMYEEARSLERQGKPMDASFIYMRILSEYTPRGTVYYERPAILLERLGQYDRAIAICNRAIKVIRAGLFHADAEAFEKRKMRLQKKKTQTSGRSRQTHSSGNLPNASQLP